MKSVLVQLDDHTYDALAKLVPAAKRQRSEFIRRAVRQAIRQVEFARMEAAYRQTPDAGPEVEDWSNWIKYQP